MGNNDKRPKIRFKGFNDDWEQHKLGDIAEFYNGDRSSRYPNDSDIVSDGIPFINAGDLVSGHVKLDTANKITEKKYNELSGAKIQLGDIIYCLRGTLGKNAFVDNFDIGTVASSLVDIRPKEIVGKFLFQVLNSDIEFRQRILNDEGAAQPNLSAKNLSMFEIPNPSRAEQIKVAEYFENLDNIISLHQRKLEKLGNIKKSMLEKMFPKDENKVPEIRFKGFNDDWEQHKFGEIFKLSQGLQIPISKRYLEKATNRYFYITNEFLKDSCEKVYYIESPAENVICTKDDILMTRTGNTGIVITDVEGCFHNNFFKIQYNKDLFSKNYICYLLKSEKMKKKILNSAGSSTIPDLSHKSFYKIDAKFPILEEQYKIGEFLKQLDSLIVLHQRKLEKLKNIKKACLEKMFV